MLIFHFSLACSINRKTSLQEYHRPFLTPHSHNAGDILQRCFISPARPSVHTNPSRKRSFLKMFFKPEDLKMPVYVLVWTENILKAQLFEDDDINIIMWLPCPNFPQHSLPQYLQSELESVQKRALACIFPEMPYREALERACLTSIREHHEDITTSLFTSISENQESELHHLIPEAYSPHYNFRRQRTDNVPAAKTNRFANSFFVKFTAVTNSSWDEWQLFNRTLSHYIYICIFVACK